MNRVRKKFLLILCISTNKTMKTSKKQLMTFSFALLCFAVHGQTLQELEKERMSKKASIATLQEEVNALQQKIDQLAGWKKTVFGTIGGSLSGFANWYSKSTPNVVAGNLGVTFNGTANLVQNSYFWRNSININLSWVKIDNQDDPEDSDRFKPAADVFNVTSLYGNRLNEKWAISGLGEYRTTLLHNFNDPGYLDIGLGITWTPTSNLVLVMHPGNYNFVFTTDQGVFGSSPGAKIVADFTTVFAEINLKSNFSMFHSYESSDLSNSTWINSLGYTLWKGIGLGLEFGFRDNRQEAANFQGVALPEAENKTQSYWLFGISYHL